MMTALLEVDPHSRRSPPPRRRLVAPRGAVVSFCALLACTLALAGCSPEPARNERPSDDPGEGSAGAVSQQPASQQQAADGQERDAAPPSDQPGSDSGDSNAGDVELTVAGADELRQAIQQREGQVVLIDFWATWCGSCIELFPHTVELHEKLGPRGLAVVTVSLDDPDDSPRVLRFLQQHDATTANFISRHGAGTKSMDVFELNGPLPRMKLYDRRGELVAQLPTPGEPLEPAALDAAIERLLSQSAD